MAGEIETLFQKHDSIAQRVSTAETQIAILNEQQRSTNNKVDSLCQSIAEWRGMVSQQTIDTNGKLDTLIGKFNRKDGAIDFAKWLIGAAIAAAGVLAVITWR